MAKTEQPNELRSYIGRLLIAAAIFALLWIAWQLRGLVLLIFGAMLVSVILRLVARPITERLRVNAGIALALAVLLVIGVIALIFWFFGSEIARQTQSLGEQLPSAWQSLQGRLEAAGWGEPLRRWLENFRSEAVGNLGRVALSVGNGIGDTLLVIVGGIYLAAQPDLYKTGLLKLIPPSRRELVGQAVHDAAQSLKLWLRGRMVSMIVVGILTAIGLNLIGIPSWLSLGLLSGLLEFIPFLGPLLSAIPAVLLALAHSPEAALWTILLYLLIQQLEGNLIEPLVQQRAVSIPPSLLLFSLVAAALLFGLAGIVLGAPLTVVLYVLVKRLYVREALATDTPLPTDSKS